MKATNIEIDNKILLKLPVLLFMENGFYNMNLGDIDEYMLKIKTYGFLEKIEGRYEIIFKNIKNNKIFIDLLDFIKDCLEKRDLRTLFDFYDQFKLLLEGNMKLKDYIAPIFVVMIHKANKSLNRYFQRTSV